MAADIIARAMASKAIEMLESGVLPPELEYAINAEVLNELMAEEG